MPDKGDTMVKEYKLTIQSAGRNEAEAIEHAARMLNAGASFDEVVFLHEVPESTDNSSELKHS